MDIQKIKELALANGFSLKEQASGNMDLHSYVYEFANAIEQAVKAQAVPDGYKVVPVEPKRETIKQMNKVWFESNCAHIMKTKTAELLYKAMIEAQEPAND